jgi:hypothetical protein
MTATNILHLPEGNTNSVFHLLYACFYLGIVHLCPYSCTKYWEILFIDMLNTAGYEITSIS